MKQGIA